MRILLISTYELGRQPLHVASPAAALKAAGHEVETVDLAVDSLDPSLLESVDRIAISVPMHTATRLADQLVKSITESHPGLPIAVYGLYAEVGAAEVDARFSGEYEPALLAWANGASNGVIRHLGKSSFKVPTRATLPDLDAYARLEHHGTTRLGGAVDTTHGCRHRCRHCPIPSVYDGRIRVVPSETVLADIDSLVTAGAGHITFGDADFLNAPAHSVPILEEAHRRHPEVTFDATVKVEHILNHSDLWARLAGSNLLFVVSAFESVNNDTLEILDKSHTVADMVEAVRLTREAGVHIRPTWLPFMPWTTTEDVAGIFEFIAAHRLVSATDPVQMSIKLLVPPGSLLENHPVMEPYIDGYDATALTRRWRYEHPEVEELQQALQAIAAEASDCDQEALPTLLQMANVVSATTGRSLPELENDGDVPRLSESWFCCSEPTQAQTVTLTRIGGR